MKNFRNSLHPAFFMAFSEKGDFRANINELFKNGEKDVKPNEDFKKMVQEKLDATKKISDGQEKLQKEKSTIEKSKNEQGEVQETLTQENFPNIEGNIVRELSNEVGKEQIDANIARFKKRCESKSEYKDKDGKEMAYKDLWSKKITEGYGDLLMALTECGYFKDKNEEAETAKIKEKYWKEVKKQYIDNIWYAGDKRFEKQKDIIFGKESKGNYPANKIYCELTGATTIIRMNKSKVTTYDVDPTKKQEIVQEGEDVVSETAKQRIKFLAHDLPNYLWEVEDKTTIQKILGWTPIIRSSVNAPSFEDKKQIEAFIKAADKLEGKDVELNLIKAFDSLQSNATEDYIKKALTANGLTLKKDRYIKYIKRVFAFYTSTQTLNNSINNQHPLYLSIIQIIQRQGGFDKAIKAFEKDVAEYKEKKDNEGKEYQKGEALDTSMKSIAEKLGIKDFTSATRLSKKSPEYFKNTAIVDILADVNNDGKISFADKGLTKTGAQFKETYNMIGEDVALPNLLAQAKMLNGTLKTEIPDAEFTPEQIKAGNKKLILLLQNTISNPGQDLYSVMLYGPDAAKRESEVYELLQKAPKSPEDPRVQKVAEEKLKGLDTSNLKIDGVEVASAEGLHQAVSGALYTEYMRGVGLGGRISFEEWAKGVSLNGGIQVSEKGTSIGLSLGYNREINLGKGWSVTPGASFGFVPMFKFGDGLAKPDWSLSGGAELAKKWISKHSVENKIGLRLSFTEVFGVAHVYSAFLGYDGDKARGIEKDIPNMKKEFNTKVTTPLLDAIANNFKDKEFDLTNAENVKYVDDAVDKVINNLLAGNKGKFNKNDIKRLKENTVRYLINYNKAPIANENVRHQIANKMAENYSYAWAEQRLQDIDGKAYFSGANIGMSWIQLGIAGVPAFHVGVGFKTQNIDMYGDRGFTSQEKEVISGSVWDEKMLALFNKNLLVSPESKFRLENGYIVIPAKAMSECDIKINPEMKGLIKKDASGNVLLSTKTFMNLPDTVIGTSSKVTKVLIGGGDASKAIALKDVLSNPSWFAEGDIDTTKLTGKEYQFTKEGLASALKDLKAKLPNDKDLQAFNFDDSILKQLEKGKKYKIVLEKLKNETTGELTGIAPRVVEVKDGDPLQIEYVGRQEIGEMMKKNAQDIADIVYGEALKVTSNRLYLISHEAPLANGKKTEKRKEYVDFAKAVKAKKYDEAADILIGKPGKKGLLSIMDEKIGQGVKFSSVSEKIKDIKNRKDEVELGQAMLSINNIFARVSSVQGGVDGKYHFKKYEKGGAIDRPIGEIIGLRAKEIERKVNNAEFSKDSKENAAIKSAYIGLINFAEKYRTEHSNEYKDTARKGSILHNAVGINLGNALSIENPLFNPEVYEGSIIEGSKLDFKGKEELRLHALEVMAKDKSLMGPIKSALNIPADTEPKNITRTKDGRISIDFGGKNVILNADMKFGYFAQCVNHMLLLDNISAEIPGEGASVNFGPSVMGKGYNIESTKGSVMKTVRTGAEITVTVRKQKKNPEPTPPEEPVDPADTEMGGGIVPETNPEITEYDENGNPKTPNTPDTPDTPPVAPEDNSGGGTSGGGRKR